MTKTVEYTVVGDLWMGCAACEQRISRVLQRLPGIEAVQASSKDQRIVVTIHPEEVSLEQYRSGWNRWDTRS